MNKPMLGLALGGLLGIFDGLSAIVSHPEDAEVRAGIMGIVFMGIFKGLIAGIIMGLVARKLDSVPLGIVIGTLVGLALALPIAIMVGKYFWEIMLPGGLVGTIVGFATQRYGARQKVTASG